MADREKVVNGLEIVKRRLSRLPGFSEEIEVVSEAIDLLKAQEPRLFDADEIVLSAEPSGWLWLEMKNGHCGEAYKAGRTINGFIHFGHGFDSSFTSLFPEDYGKTWRCWTFRPTDEQRRATPWN